MDKSTDTSTKAVHTPQNKAQTAASDGSPRRARAGSTMAYFESEQTEDGSGGNRWNTAEYKYIQVREHAYIMQRRPTYSTTRSERSKRSRRSKPENQRFNVI